jgi:hypothetical protein
MIGYSIPSLFETRALFHAEFRFAMVKGRGGFPRLLKVCAPQVWSAASPFLLFEGLLRFKD